MKSQTPGCCTELVAALKGLIAASAHMSPFGGEASVKSVRLAGKYMKAHDAALAAIAKAEGMREVLR